MLRQIIFHYKKLKTCLPVMRARLPGIAETVRTTLVYVAIIALFMGLSSSWVLYQSWRQLSRNRPEFAQATVMPEKASVTFSLDQPKTADVGQTVGDRSGLEQAAVEDKTKKIVTPAWLTEARSQKMRKPLEGKIVSSFGWHEDQIYKDWRFHSGVDVEARQGSAVKSAKSGTVKEVSSDSRDMLIKIEHGDGLTTAYRHLATSYVQVGEIVKQGANIGRLAEDSHILHFEVWQDQHSVSPENMWPGE